MTAGRIRRHPPGSSGRPSRRSRPVTGTWPASPAAPAFRGDGSGGEARLAARGRPRGDPCRVPRRCGRGDGGAVRPRSGSGSGRAPRRSRSKGASSPMSRSKTCTRRIEVAIRQVVRRQVAVAEPYVASILTIAQVHVVLLRAGEAGESECRPPEPYGGWLGRPRVDRLLEFSLSSGEGLVGRHGPFTYGSVGYTAPVAGRGDCAPGGSCSRPERVAGVHGALPA